MMQNKLLVIQFTTLNDIIKNLINKTGIILHK